MTGHSDDDLQAWRNVGDATVLALEQDDAHLQRPDIALHGARAKYLRLRRLDDWQLPAAGLGPAQTSAGNAALQPPAPPLPWRRWILWIVLVAAAAVVGGFALSLLRGAKNDGQL